MILGVDVHGMLLVFLDVGISNGSDSCSDAGSNIQKEKCALSHDASCSSSDILMEPGEYFLLLFRIKLHGRCECGDSRFLDLLNYRFVFQSGAEGMQDRDVQRIGASPSTQRNVQVLSTHVSSMLAIWGVWIRSNRHRRIQETSQDLHLSD